MSQYGVSPYGYGLTPFGGPGLIGVFGVLVASTNRVIAVFDKIPLQNDRAGLRSAINRNNWRLTPIDPTIEGVVPPGLVVPTRSIGIFRCHVDPIDRKQIHITADTTMEDGVRYTLRAVGDLHGEQCEQFVGDKEFVFQAPYHGPNLALKVSTVGLYRDLDDGYDDKLDASGIWRYTDSRDIALEPELRSLRKRIIRIIFTDMGEWTSAPDFGAGVRLKTIVRPTELQQLSNRIAGQIQKQPDVEAASATLRVINFEGDYFIDLTVRVKPLGQRDMSLELRIDPTK
ncbi:MAG: hypothetical protein VW516_00215 [Rhodospirillaceae bacterium]